MHSSWSSGFPISSSQEGMPIQRRATFGYKVVRAIGIPLLHLFFRIDVQGLENIPPAPYVLIANHLNWLDSFLILMAFPREPRIHLLGDPELLKQRRLQWWIVRHVAGYITVDRHRRTDSGMFERVNRCLQ